MAWGTTAGIQAPYAAQNANVIPPDVFRMAIDYYPNRCPLLYQLSKKPLNALTFYMNNEVYRPRTATLNAAWSSSAASGTFTLVDATGIDVGDVLEVDSERFLVTAVGNATSITVTPNFESTAQANHANAASVTIITSAATGAEVDKNAMSQLPNAVAQYAQVTQKAYQVGGALQSTASFMGGAITPLQRDKQYAVQHAMDDFERAMYYGKGVTRSSTVTNQTMKGYKTICATNNVTSPTNGSGYKPSDFIRDTVQRCFDNGGEPDLLLVATNFMTGFSQWTWNLQFLDTGETSMGVKPVEIQVPFLPGITIVPAPLLASGTVICTNRREASIAMKRALADKPRGSRGDAEEGDIIMEGAIDVENEAHHGYVSGVSGFAVQS